MTGSAAVVVGVGPSEGLGAALARRFGQEGLRVFLAGRSAARLETIANEIRAGGGRANPCVTDATAEGDLRALFDVVEAAGCRPELVAFSVGANQPAPLLDTTPEGFENLWRQNCLAGFLTGREAVRRMLPHRSGTILFMGATASVRARPPFTAFASAKAGLRAVAQGIAREFGSEGLHVAHVVIDGVIDGEYARSHFPAHVQSKGAEGLMRPDDIARVCWQLHCQPRSTWTHELDLRPCGEPF